MPKQMRFKIFMVVLAVSLLTLTGVVSAQPRQQSNEQEVTHLLLAVSGTVNINREGWDDYNTFSPAFPGTPVRARDYLQVAGNSQAIILCADLTVVEQYADGIVQCDSNPNPTAFVYLNEAVWKDAPQPAPAATSLSTIPENANGVSTTTLSSQDEAILNAALSALSSLGLDEESLAYATANLYAQFGLYYDAINTILATSTRQCVERPFVDADTSDGVISVFESPMTYIRLGEWYHMIDGADASDQFLHCGFELAGTLADIASQALAAARLADFSTDATDKINWYQQAINLYAPLTDSGSLQSLIEACGSSNCTLP
ncbi:MAG: hypothetical protein HY862_21300 [Chloroflexi bacterium]|nr:hypothetical protein [Chloroflexota bacterium]